MEVLKSILGPMSKYSAHSSDLISDGNQLLQGPTWPRLRVEQRRWGGFKQSSPVTRFVTHPYNTSYKGYE
jgi:hypothetical protein